MNTEKFWIASFDIGIKNFAFVILSFSLNKKNEMIENNLSFKDRYHSFSKECTLSFQKYMEKYIYPHFDIVHFENLDIQNDKKDLSQTFQDIHDILDSYFLLWENTHVVLIEQQMQFKHNSNIKALKISQHIYSHFLIKYKHVHILEYPAYYKTQIFGAPMKLKKHERKKWAVEKVFDILHFKNMTHLIEKYKKKDDLSDCILMCISYFYQNIDDEKKNK